MMDNSSQKRQREEKNFIEEHLLTCDRCLDTFLSFITVEEVEQARLKISPDFTKRILKKASRQGKIKTKSSRQNLSFYVAAALLTLVFMGNGFFQMLVNFEPKLESPRRLQELNLNLDWSDRVVNQTATWIEKFETQSKEVRNEKKE